MMQCRYDALSQSIGGYAQTHIPLILDNGKELVPAVTADDIGIYCLIPKMCYHFGLSLDSAILWFFNFITFGSLAFGLFGFFLLYRSWIARIISWSGLLFASLIVCKYGFTDVYRAASIMLAIIPLSLYFLHKNTQSKWLPTFLFCTGMAAGFFNYIRGHSGTTALVFVLGLLLLNSAFAWRKKAWLCLFVAGGFVLPIIYFNHQYHLYKTYAQSHFPHQNLDSGVHVFWHQIYIGLGYLQNPYGFAYDDNVAIAKVHELNAKIAYPSKESEHLLANELMHFTQQHPFFVIATVGAKMGILFLFFILYANIGIFAALWRRKRTIIDEAFFLLLLISALPGILAIPSEQYSLAFIATAILFNIITVVSFFKHDTPSKGCHE